MGNAGQKCGGGAREMPVYDSYARLSWNPTTRELEKIESQLSDNARVIERMGGTTSRGSGTRRGCARRGARRGCRRPCGMCAAPTGVGGRGGNTRLTMSARR